MALVSHQAGMFKPALDPHATTTPTNGNAATPATSATPTANGAPPIPNGVLKASTANGNPLHKGVAPLNGAAAGTANGATQAPLGASTNAILTAAQPYFQAPVSPQEFTPDRPIGYGAFGVVWYAFLSSSFHSLF